MEVRTKEFLLAIFGQEDSENSRHIEIRPLGKTSQPPLFYYNVDALCRDMKRIKELNREGANIYFGVCPRKEEKGKKEAVKEVKVLWADLDCKEESKDDALGRVKAFPLKPSITVDSGNGLHLYWLLIASVDPDPEVEGILKGLARALEGDMAVTDVSRVMRLPETLNMKDPLDPKLCKILSFEPERKYSIEDFADYRQPAQDKRVDQEEPITRSPANAYRVLEDCIFIRYCRDNAATLSEPLWYAMISNLARCEGGQRIIHELSSLYPTYNHKETEAKIAHGLTDTGPHTCIKIQELGFKGCPTGGCGVTSPVVLGKKKKKGKKEMDKEVKYTADFPGLIDIGIEEDGRVCFITLEEGGLKTDHEVTLNGETCISPSKDSLIWLPPRVKEVKMWYEGDSDKKLYDDLVDFLKSVSELPLEAHYDFLALWIFHTYLLEKFDYSPYIWLFAIPDRGKTRTGKACIHMAYRGIHIESLKEANLIRYANHFKATLFIDVKDIWQKTQKAGSEDILLARYEKGIVVSRVFNPDKGPFRDMVNFEVFGATVIATNEQVDSTLESRAVQINMPESSKGFEKNIRAIDLLPFRERLTAFRARHMNTLLPEVNKIAQRRLGDIIRPLHQILVLVKSEKESVLKDLVKGIESERKAVASETDEGRILRAIIKLIKWSGKDTLSVKSITEEINMGVPDTYKKGPARVGRILDSMGFEKTRMSDGRYIICDEKQIDLMKERFGLKIQDPVEEKATQTTRPTLMG
ncbi:hypothetical protein METP3_00467 [Methanosarcinales archaeon]|nr:hypothetical protein METP3_00467 [Methanosarcinales archaeon]